MTRKSLQLHVSSTIGAVSAEYIIPEKTSCIMTLAHGAGAGMDHSFMKALATLLADEGIATLRFNFPFAEQKKKRPDVPAVAHKTIEAALNHAHNFFPTLSLFASGKSFGGRRTSQFLAADTGNTVTSIVFFGFPLHPAKKPSIERADHLKNIQLPMLFLQGTRDELATVKLMEDVCATLPSATLVKIEGADHGFKKGKQDLVPELAKHTREWIDSLLK
jgi:hypothetical protein